MGAAGVHVRSWHVGIRRVNVGFLAVVRTPLLVVELLRSRVNWVEHNYFWLCTVFKLDRGEAYCWYDDHPTAGHLAVLDLVSAKQHFISCSWQTHGSRYRSGERHQKLVTDRSRVNVGDYRDTPIEDLISDSLIRSVTVPLIEPFEFWPVDCPVWPAVKSPHTLTRTDFGEDVDGVVLHGYVCRHDRVDDLVARWRKITARSWTACDGEFDLVVLAKVVRIPNPPRPI